MQTIKQLLHVVSSFSLAPLIARAAALISATVVLAYIGQGALTRLDTLAVKPAYAAAGLASAARDANPAQGADSQQPEAAVDGHQAAPPHSVPRSHAAPSKQASCAGAPGCSGEGKPGVTADGRIILNTANAAELVKLPGVGPRRAAAILALRKRLGRFRRVRDLLRVRGIGFRSLRKIEPLVVVDSPKGAPKQKGSNTPQQP